MTPEELEQGKKDIDSMSQEDMARLWRFVPNGHPYEEIMTCDFEQCKCNYGGICISTSSDECPKNNKQSAYEKPELLK